MRLEPSPPTDANEEIPALIQTLVATERRLVELTGGEVDAVADSEGRTFLLRSAQEQLRVADGERQAAILNALPAHIALLDTQGCIISVNEGWRQFVTTDVIQSPGYGIGSNYLEICQHALGEGSSEAIRVAEGIKSVMSGREKSFSMEYACHSPTEQRWFLLSVTPLADDRRTGAVVMHLDVTERMQADETRLLLAKIVESSNDAVIGESLEGIVTSWNRGAEKIFGFSAEEMIGRSITAILPLGCGDEESGILDCVSRGEEVSQVEKRRVRKDGVEIYVLATISPIKNADGKVVGASKIVRDITGRKQSDLRLKLQHAVTEMLAEASASTDIHLKILEILCRGMDWELGGLWLVDRAAKVLRCAEVWHYPSTEFAGFATVSQSLALKMGQGLAGAVWASGASEWSSDIVEDARFAPRPQVAQLQLRGWIAFPIRMREEVLGVAEFFTEKMHPPDAETLAMLGAIGAQIGIFLERRQLAEQFRQAQKMEAIGTLAGGIAHDFNNILAAINGYTELSRIILTDNPEVRSNLDAILQASSRATHLVRQILAFSRQQKLERRSIQLLPVLEETLALLRSTIPSTIEFETSLSTDAPTVLADTTQIHQVLMNLGTNAWHAMKDGIGRLKVSLERYVVDAANAATHAQLGPGVYARISVSDTGSGMDQATQQRIFEPFFTTKPPGEGTGLGLAVVHGIMDSHDGAITVFSQLGEGTVFHLYFPAHSTDAILTASEDLPVPRGQGERILFVDDEELLVQVGQKVLVALGYEVESTTLPMEALEWVRAAPQRFALVITDQTMPKMTGLALATQLQQLRPGLPVILTTGYTQSLSSAAVDTAGLRQVLVKPFTVHSLGTAVHSVLFPPVSLEQSHG